MLSVTCSLNYLQQQQQGVIEIAAVCKMCYFILHLCTALHCSASIGWVFIIWAISHKFVLLVGYWLVAAEVKPSQEHAGATLEIPSEEILGRSSAQGEGKE